MISILTLISNVGPLTSNSLNQPWTPESVLITVGGSVITLLITVVGWLFNKQLNNILQRMDSFMNKQTLCREELSSRFSEKEQTNRHIKNLYNRTDKHESMLQRHSVLLDDRNN